jgi:uncharacterized protein (TIGR03382 family)
MKMAALAALAAVASAANASVTYTDSSNELFNNGFGHLDIQSVVVDHDATNLYFNINLRGSVDDTNWGKYCIGIDTVGNTINSSGNGWGRNISWGGQGIDYWIASWADDGGSNFGGEVRQMTEANGNGNSLLAATYLNSPGFSGTSVGTQQTFVISRALLGLTSDQTFTFDVITTGSNFDPGVDHLSRADQATSGWGNQSTAGTFNSYTIPTPGSVALLGLGTLAALRRRR